MKTFTNPFFNLAFAPLVVAQRLPLLFMEAAGRKGVGRPETERMVTEKALAVQSGLMGAQIEWMKAGFQVTNALMGGKPLKGAAALAEGARRAAGAAAAPAGKRVRANVRRLSRKPIGS